MWVILAPSDKFVHMFSTDKISLAKAKGCFAVGRLELVEVEVSHFFEGFDHFGIELLRKQVQDRFKTLTSSFNFLAIALQGDTFSCKDSLFYFRLLRKKAML